MSVQDRIKTLTCQRGIIKGQLTRFLTFMEDIANHSKIEELNIRIQRLESVWVDFMNIQSEIDLIDESSGETLERQNFEDKYFRAVGEANRIINKHTAEVARQTRVNNITDGNAIDSANNLNVKLPLINLPTFDGTYEAWLPFFEGFKALVLDNLSLNNIQRFYYLRSCLKNNSDQVIQSIEINDTNFDVAWRLLRDRYENKRVIIHSHVKGIFELPTMGKENYLLFRKFIDTLLRHYRALQSLGQPVENWDTLLIYLLSNKLDNNSKREWEASIKTNQLPDFTQFIEFIKYKAQLLETLDAKDSTKLNISKDKNPFKSSNFVTNQNFIKTELCCNFCKNNHYTYKCEKLLALTSNQRCSELKKRNICQNCLRSGHLVDSCKSDRVCKTCKGRHNTALHIDKFAENKSTCQQKSSEEQTSSNTTLVSNAVTQILLPTVQLCILDIHGNSIKCRALLDSGSQSNFITQRLLQATGLKSSKIHLPITGISQTSLNISQQVTASIHSIDQNFHTNLSFLVLQNITNNLPQLSFDYHQLNIPEDIELSDPEFCKPNKIDMLLGSGIFFNLLNTKMIKLDATQLILQHTKLGWILAGPLQAYASITSSANFPMSTVSPDCLFTQQSDFSLHEKVERFWELENISSSHSKLSDEELECEVHFRKHFQQDETGRCMVSLPLKSNYTSLGHSLPIAIRRLKLMEKKLEQNKTQQKQYHAFLEEYESLGHMTKINPDLDDPNIIYNYLPHHAVVKDSSDTTRLRVVFDASSKTSSGLSLNDVLKTGPTIQDDLLSILLRMRTHNIVITADITKMYRQINICPSERHLQRIVWRKNPDDPINHFALNTITYGTASASFLATRTLHEIGVRHKNTDSVAGEVITSNFYMDDLIFGAPDVSRARDLKCRVEKILLSAGLPLRKWLSNNSNVFDSQYSNDHSSHYILSDSKDVKTLGITWNPRDDTFLYSFNLSQNNQVFTKRIILSQIASIFDPLGLISPCIVQAKLLMQQLWQLPIGWDDPVPNELMQQWIHFTENFSFIMDIKIPRQMLFPETTYVSLHGFCDASESAFGACIYIVSTLNNNLSKSRLVCAKSRLAPLKTLSLPRLELCGALLLSQLMDKLTRSLKSLETITYFWTDSTIVLSWLKAEPNKWKTFVANRVAEIQSLTEGSMWRHVRSADNPADVVSRGLDAANLKDCNIWWQGPSWLTKSCSDWPDEQILHIEPLPEARKEKISLKYHCSQNDNLINRFSNFSKLLQVTAYLLRFVNNTKNDIKFYGRLSDQELQNAIIYLCRIVQRNEFMTEMQLLSTSKLIPKSSKLLSLNPFLDPNGLIRVGGRIKNASIPYDQKHQIILPGKHMFTRLLIKHEHHKHLHAGAQLILSRIRAQFWPLDGRNSVRSVLRDCITCFRACPRAATQLMGDLPKYRVTPSRPFSYCGIDYTGFYNLKDGKSRTRTYIKSYLCIFVCLATKAVHVELVSDLTTVGFMKAFKRFVSRRGLCKHIYTDNGTNFVGANNELREIHKVLTSLPTSHYSNYFLENRIEWHFIPARSPHVGGIWEAAVKSFKFHIKRVLSHDNFTFEDFYTVLTQIEAILNSRPLYPMSNDPHDLQPLTPGHFLIGDALSAEPQECVKDIPINRLSAFKVLQNKIQHFWAVWSRDYLNHLQQRSKWKVNSENITIDTLVLLKEDNIPPMNWQLGRVVEVHSGQDQRVRVLSIRTSSGVVRRAIQRVCPLPAIDN